MASLKTNNQS